MDDGQINLAQADYLVIGTLDSYEKLREYYGRKYGENEVQQAFLGRTNGIRMSVVYYPEINRYQGNESIQIVIKNYQ